MSDQDGGPDVTPRDALAIAQRALAKANDLEADRDRIDDLADRVAQLELRVSALDEDRAYESLTTDDRIGLVREHAFEKATETTGKAALDYNAIKWEVFDGEPSADYCYTLMERAAETDGFNVETPPSGNRSLVVDAAAAKRGAVFSSANKDAHTEGRSA